jgi:hypothetical protein
MRREQRVLAVPGPPPRTSIEATAGRSNRIAVTPEAITASSAWPTATPAISVRRFFTMCPVRLLSDRSGIAAATDAATVRHSGRVGCGKTCGLPSKKTPRRTGASCNSDASEREGPYEPFWLTSA